MASKKKNFASANFILPDSILSILLQDKTTHQNIIWATDDYAEINLSFSFFNEIKLESISGKNTNLIVPRVQKKDELKSQRSKDKGEVFTPSWICNIQNNLIDNSWFGKAAKRFNTELDYSWRTNYYPISFSNIAGKAWTDYINTSRLEVSCGEAPYLTSRYDTVTGKPIPVKNRIGLLDRKLRVISENTNDSQDWIRWAIKALKSTYGFEWQGDNLFLARKNVLLAVLEAYNYKFNCIPNLDIIDSFANIIVWNIWQMDGIKYVKPNSCHNSEYKTIDLFGRVITSAEQCPGCLSNDMYRHNGIYATIMDWEENKEIRFVDLIKKGTSYGKL